MEHVSTQIRTVAPLIVRAATARYGIVAPFSAPNAWPDGVGFDRSNHEAAFRHFASFHGLKARKAIRYSETAYKVRARSLVILLNVPDLRNAREWWRAEPVDVRRAAVRAARESEFSRSEVFFVRSVVAPAGRLFHAAPSSRRIASLHSSISRSAASSAASPCAVRP